MKNFWMPTKPLSVIDLINRKCLATGSISNAQRGSDADYNGHAVIVNYNSYRKYYIAEYFWAGRRVLARGTIRECILPSIEFYKQDGRGAQLTIFPVTDEDVKVCESFDLLQEFSETSSKAHRDSWWTWKHERVSYALDLYKRWGVPFKLLLDAQSSEDWDSSVDNLLYPRKSR